MDNIRPIDWRGLRTLHDVCTALLEPTALDAAFAETRRTAKLADEQQARPDYNFMEEKQVLVASADGDWHTQLVIAVRALAACMNCAERLPAASHDTWSSAWVTEPENIRLLPYARTMVRSAASLLKTYDATPAASGQPPTLDSTPTA